MFRGCSQPGAPISSGDAILKFSNSFFSSEILRPSVRGLGTLVIAVMLVAFSASSLPAQEKDAEPDNEISDPLESFNRAMFDFNLFLDDAIGKPLAEAYRNVLPEPVRDSIRNFIRNLNSPVILANDLLQGEGERANDTLARFLVNSTLGVGGLFDVAFDMGYSYHSEDFGQTLAVHGVKEGPYLVLPVLGPSSLRGTTGKAVDTFLNPLTYIAAANDADIWLYGMRGTDAVDFRSRNIESLDQLKRDSLDFYSLIRSIYDQHRRNEILNGKTEK